MLTDNSVAGFILKPEDFRMTGHDLARPECILAHPSGALVVADRRGAFTHIAPDGTQRLFGRQKALPNGMAMMRDGSVLVANIETGQLFRVVQNGEEVLVAAAIGDDQIGSLNFVYVDHQDRIWLTVSTRTIPRRAALEKAIPDGMLLRMDEVGRLTVVARDLFFPNEVRVTEDGRTLYIAETTAGRVLRTELDSAGMPLGFAPYGRSPLFDGAQIDGITLDSLGNLWVTELTRNALLVVRPDGTHHIAFDDPEGQVLKLPTSITFGGPDLRTAYVGSLVQKRLPTFNAPVPGASQPYWGIARDIFA